MYMSAPRGTNTGGSNDETVIAILLTLILPGLGHYYLGWETKAVWWMVGIFVYYAIAILLTFFLIGIVFLLFAPVLHLICLIDVVRMS